jgi:hypothetical protein
MRLTWAASAVIVALTMGIVYQREELKRTQEQVSSASSLLELQARVNRVAFKTLDSCRALNEDLTFRGQAKLQAMFSDEATRLRRDRQNWKPKTRLARSDVATSTDAP